MNYNKNFYSLPIKFKKSNAYGIKYAIIGKADTFFNASGTNCYIITFARNGNLDIYINFSKKEYGEYFFDNFKNLCFGRLKSCGKFMHPYQYFYFYLNKK